MTATRQAIVDAITAADVGLSPSTTKTGPVSPGDAWPVWRSTTFPNIHTAFNTWEVFVALPDAGADVTAAEADPLVASVAAALRAAGLQIELVEPVRVGVVEGSNGTPALRFTAHD